MENILRIHNIWPPSRDSKIMKDRLCETEQFEGRIILMSMFNDIVWEKEEMQRNVKRILE